MAPAFAGRLFCVSALLILPLAASLWRARDAELDHGGRWLRRGEVTRALTLAAVTAWGALFNSFGRFYPTWFWMLVFMSAGIFLSKVIDYRGSALALKRRWTPRDRIRLAFWNTLAQPLPLLMVAVSFDAAFSRSWTALLWLVVAGFTTLVALARLREAEGFTPRKIKSGPVYKRAMLLSRKLSVVVDEVCVMPFGRGHLTNAFAGWKKLGISDDYGLWLDGQELDFVIAHELAHLKLRHIVRKLLYCAAIFAVALMAALFASRSATALQPLWKFAFLLGSVASAYFVSRRFEYEADGLAAQIAGGPEIGVRALAQLQQRTGALLETSYIGELFSTHPSLGRRMRRLSKTGQRAPLELHEVGGE